MPEFMAAVTFFLRLSLTFSAHLYIGNRDVISACCTVYTIESVFKKLFLLRAIAILTHATARLAKSRAGGADDDVSICSIVSPIA
jgi:hypothetical protein